MKIFIDLYHIPQYNFFRNTIKQLGPSQVDIACVNRSRLAAIIKHECPEFSLLILGDYKDNKGPASMTFKIILPRVFSLLKLFLKKKYDFVITAHYQANVAAKLAGIPNISILDDPRAGVMTLAKLSANELYLPPFAGSYKGTKPFNALKEWAYLSPSYFKPDESILKEYGLNSKEYIFAREVSTKTSNYLLQNNDIILSLAEKLPPDIKIVLSLENKENKHLYPESWIILEEPVKDIHSLMYFAKLVISSGDSMAREGAMLGVPSLYLGFRNMPANQILIEEKMLFKVKPEEAESFFNDFMADRFVFKTQEEFRQYLFTKWIDVTGFILDKVKEYVH